MTQINIEDNIYLVLQGTKTTNKESFLSELPILLKFKSQTVKDWDQLKEDLNLISPLICSLFNENSSNNIDKIIVIWLDPLDFSKYNSADFWIALDILKGITEDESNPLIFVLAGNVSSINTELYK